VLLHQKNTDRILCDLRPVAGLFFEARKTKENPEISETKEISFVSCSNSMILTKWGNSFELKETKETPEI